VRLLAAGGLLICIAFAMVGIALPGGIGTILFLVASVLGMGLTGVVLAPPWRPEAGGSRGVAEGRWLASVVAGAFVVRCVGSALLHETGWWEFLGGDEGTFDANGRYFCAWVQGLLPFRLGQALMTQGELAYPHIVGALYYAFGITKFWPLLINAIVGACIVYPVHDLAGRFGGRTAARRSALLVAYFPSLVLWSTLMVRDSWVLLLIASALLFADRLRRKFSVRTLVGLVFCVGMLSLFRNYIFFVVAAGIAGGILLGGRSLPQAIFVGGLFMAALVVGIRSDALADSAWERASLQHIAQQRTLNSMGPSMAGSLGDADVSTPTKALTYLPLGLLYFYCSPLPWQIGSARSLFAVMDLLVWYACLPAILVGVAWLLRHRFRAILPTFLVVIGISVLYALVEGNIGILFRHRAQIIVPLCAVAGAGVARKRRLARKESRQREDPRAFDPAPGGALRPAPGLPLPARAP
jgi:4-amino-4-deoxy-L-arabinose transferase-like glycosyltransferase